MIEANDKVMVGISGGADSVCLLFVLLELSREMHFKLLAVHVNHGLRGAEADRDEEFVRRLCAECGVEFVCRHCGVRDRAEREKLSLEEAGRLCRYEIFSEEAKSHGCNKIAVAHHANDQAETMLFHLFRGSGLRGLAGMEPVSGNRIRPLLCVERREIEEWLKERGISYCTDSTNQEEVYTRNRIRGRVIPCAEEMNTAAVRHMGEAAEELRRVEEYLEEETRAASERCVSREADGIHIRKEAFEQLQPLLQGRLLRRCIEEAGGGLKDVERTHIRLLRELFGKQTGSSLDLPGDRRAVREYQGIRLGKAGEEAFGAAGGQAVCPQIPGILDIDGKKWTFSLENIEKTELIPEKTYTKWFDYDKITKCLEIRGRLPGDYLEINRDHNTKKLKNYFIDEKIPGQDRERIWLLADGNHIIWIPGRRISERYKVTEETRRILKVQISGGNENG
jgi:tRNA(Ile)-lysidine synthase